MLVLWCRRREFEITNKTELKENVYMVTAVVRGIIVGLGLIFQILLSLAIYLLLGEHIAFINIIYSILGFLLVLGLIRNSKNYSYTLPWIIILLLFPLIGTLLFLIIGDNKHRSKILKSIVKSEANSKKYFEQDETIREEIKNNSKLRYITDYAKYPVSKNNDVEYYPLGELAFEEMLKELKRAEKFIFFEYFIVQPR